MASFVLDLGTLQAGSNRVLAEADPRELDLPAEEWIGPVRAELRVEKSGERISVRGTVASTARLECVRCLAGFEMPVTTPLEVFADRAGTGRRSEEEALDRDDYMRFHDGRHLDLREDAREALLLEIPISPHCREDCRGLCPTCGADWNAGPCEHARNADAEGSAPA